jgi:hypothetical protein
LAKIQAITVPRPRKDTDQKKRPKIKSIAPNADQNCVQFATITTLCGMDAAAPMTLDNMRLSLASLLEFLDAAILLHSSVFMKLRSPGGAFGPSA